MNIDDTTAPECPDTFDEAIGLMFERQKSLMTKYGPIERSNGGNVPDVYSLQDKRCQWRIKEDFWRTTEEIAEAWEHKDDFFGSLEVWDEVFEDNSKIRHFFEELADAMHFFIEATIHSGFDIIEEDLFSAYLAAVSETSGLVTSAHDCEQYCWKFTKKIGLAANELKIKPWKQTHMQTDVVRYKTLLKEAWELWFKVWCSLGCTYNFFFELYFRKSEVNKFRQRSNY